MLQHVLRPRPHTLGLYFSLFSGSGTLQASTWIMDLLKYAWSQLCLKYQQQTLWYSSKARLHIILLQGEKKTWHLLEFYHCETVSKWKRNCGHPSLYLANWCVRCAFVSLVFTTFFTDLYRLLSLVKGAEQIFMFLAMMIHPKAAVFESPPYTVCDLLFTR